MLLPTFVIRNESHFTSVWLRETQHKKYIQWNRNETLFLQFQLSEQIWLEICNISNDNNNTKTKQVTVIVISNDFMSNARIEVSVGFKQDSLAMLSDCNRYADFRFNFYLRETVWLVETDFFFLVLPASTRYFTIFSQNCRFAPRNLYFFS